MKARAIGNCTPWLEPIGRPKHHPFASVADGLIDEPARVANALGGDENTFGIQTIEQVVEPAPLLPDKRLRREAQVAEEQHIRLLVDHCLDRPNFQTVAGRSEVDQEETHPLRLFLDLVVGDGPSEQEEEV